MSMDSGKFFKALGFFASGVTVITGRGPSGEPAGVTLNGFAPVYLDPPLILNCLAIITGGLSAFGGGERFAGPREHKFKNRGYQTGNSGYPILPGCLVNPECTRVAVHEAGDRVIVVGHVDRLEKSENGRPLLSTRSAFGRVEDA